MKRRDFFKTPVAGILLAADGGRVAPLLEETRGPAPQVVTKQEAQQRMHPDYITYFDGIEYFWIGNGDITGVVQYSPKDPLSSFFGLTLMDPERFCRKWSTYLYHPERGFSGTRVGVAISETRAGEAGQAGMIHGVRGYSIAPENFRSVRWKYVDGVPVTSLIWRAGECEIEEEFFVPSEGALFFRRVTVKNLTGGELGVALSALLYPNFGLFDEISTDEQARTANAAGVARVKLFALEKEATVSGRYEVKIDLGTIARGDTKQATYVYALNGQEIILKKKGFARLWKETTAYWAEKSAFVSGNATLDHLFDASKTGMKGIRSRRGKMDAAPWMYNMEWISDGLSAAEAMLRIGLVDEARVMVRKNLRSGIGFDGRTIESSRWFGYEYTEVNQNGGVLYSLWAYACWTGDFDLIRRNWKKIKLCGDFPLKDYFLDDRTRMVRNKREFWERSDPHGIEDGYEMAYQFWVSFGLEKGAELADLVGDGATARRWRSAAAAMKTAMLADPKFMMIEDGHLIKRRTRDGRWQRYTIPPDPKRMPPGSPLATEPKPSLEPDAAEAQPIYFEAIDPRGELATNTLRWLEQSWNQMWEGGGYPRYNATSDDNPPAPWPIASLLIARAYAAAGDDEKVWRVLTWLKSIHGGEAGAWFERYGQSITPPMPPVCILNWVWYELIALCVHHIAGVRPALQQLVICPHLLQGIDELHCTHTIRGTKLDLTVRRTLEKCSASVNGREVELKNGAITIPYPKRTNLTVVVNTMGNRDACK